MTRTRTWHFRVGALACLSALAVVPPRPASAVQAPLGRIGDLYVANLQDGSVSVFDGGSGRFRGTIVPAGVGGLRAATGITFGPDGALFVSSSATNQILVYDPDTGAPRGAFIDGDELASPFSLVFGPDGDLYVSSGQGHRILRYDGTTGARKGEGLRAEDLRTPIGLAFGPDGLLYVANAGGNSVLRFDPVTAERIDAFATDSLRFPSDLAFGPDGSLYVSSAFEGTVVRFDAATGSLSGLPTRLPRPGAVPVGLALDPDGRLFVADFRGSRLYRLDLASGEVALMDTTGLAGPENIAIRPRWGGAAQARTYVLDAADAISFGEPFSLLDGARELSDGRLVVSDWLEERVDIIDFATGDRVPVGSPGAGPDEYRLPSGLLAFRGDSTILVDLGNTRLSVIGPDASIHRTIRVTRPGAASPGAVDRSGRVYYVQPGWVTGDPPDSRSPRPLVAWRPEDDDLDEIARVDVARPRSDAGGRRTTLGIPFVMFSARDAWAAGPDGWVAIVRWSPFAVEWHRDDEVVRGAPLAYDPQPVSARDREAFVRRFLEQSPMSGRGPDGGLGQTPSMTDREILEIVAANEFAEEHAPFDPDGVFMDPVGRVWIVRTPATRSPVTVDVFRRGSDRIASITLPPGRSLLSAGTSHLYAVWRDDLDLERLERYEIPFSP